MPAPPPPVAQGVPRRLHALRPASRVSWSLSRHEGGTDAVDTVANRRASAGEVRIPFEAHAYRLAPDVGRRHDLVQSQPGGKSNGAGRGLSVPRHRRNDVDLLRLGDLV